MNRVKLLTVQESEVYTVADFAEYCKAELNSPITRVHDSSTLALTTVRIPVELYHIRTGEYHTHPVTGRYEPVYKKELYAIDPQLKEIIEVGFKTKIDDLHLKLRQKEQQLSEKSAALHKALAIANELQDELDRTLGHRIMAFLNKLGLLK